MLLELIALKKIVEVTAEKVGLPLINEMIGKLENKQHHMGTVEPVYKEPLGQWDKGDYDKAAFIRGFVTKYKNAGLSSAEIMEYLEQLVA